MNLEYHKGQFCSYSPVFCQEGHCSGCAIYCQSLLRGALVYQDADVKNLEKREDRELMVSLKDPDVVK